MLILFKIYINKRLWHTLNNVLKRVNKKARTIVKINGVIVIITAVIILEKTRHKTIKLLITTNKK